MSQFQILNERRFPLKTIDSEKSFTLNNWNGKNSYKDMLPYWRWEHRVTLGWGTREFMVFVDQLKQAIYIEEVIGGHLDSVKDDSLFSAILKFIEEKGFCNILPPLTKPMSERFI
jgi:hypothetical protein